MDDSLYNVYYDRPAVLSLLPPVQGKRILDIGCGPGLYSVWRKKSYPLWPTGARNQAREALLERFVTTFSI